MNFIESCEVCQRLSDAYETATMEWFRVQGQLRVAEFSHDDEASGRIVAELTEIAKRRQALKQRSETHRLQAHPKVSTAGSSE